jgi:uracil-DNA glycosylase family 4
VSDLSGCQLCPRLAAHRATVKLRYPDYHCAPVTAFGEPNARLLIVGLAPGLHGANASGRPFTGDASGDLLFAALHEHGFASQAQSRSSADGMRLIDCRLTNAVKCLPPRNQPRPAETITCNRFLQDEIGYLPAGGALLTLGGIAHRAVTRALGLRNAEYPFSRAAVYDFDGRLTLFSSYHPSRYNLNTGRISAASFAAVFARIRELLQ